MEQNVFVLGKINASLGKYLMEQNVFFLNINAQKIHNGMELFVILYLVHVLQDFMEQDHNAIQFHKNVFLQHSGIMINAQLKIKIAQKELISEVDIVSHIFLAIIKKLGIQI